LVPETLTFYRKPIPTTPPPAHSTPNISPLIAKGTEEPDQQKTAPLAIYGSVSASDIVSYIKGLLVNDSEGSRIVLEPEQIRFLGLEEEDADRIKALGRWEIEISPGDSALEPVRKVVEILPETDGSLEAKA
jgi:hypothetical protein